MSDQAGMQGHLRGPLQHNISALHKGEMGGAACSYSSRKELGDRSQALKSKFQPGKLGCSALHQTRAHFAWSSSMCTPITVLFFHQLGQQGYEVT